MKKEKDCALCTQPQTIAYRIQYQHPLQWVFVCKNCLENVKTANPLYKYGGTWKG